MGELFLCQVDIRERNVSMLYGVVIFLLQSLDTMKVTEV